MLPFLVKTQITHQVTDDFLNAVIEDKDWKLINRIDNSVTKQLEQKTSGIKLGIQLGPALILVFSFIQQLMTGTRAQKVEKLELQTHAQNICS